MGHEFQTLYDNRTAGLKIDNATGDLWFFFSFYKGGMPMFRLDMGFDEAKAYADTSREILGDRDPADNFGGW